MLDTYKTNPVNEINKIKTILNRSGYVDFVYRHLSDGFEMVFANTSFASYEPSFKDFLNNIIFKDYNPKDLQTAITSYRYFSEFLMALIDYGVDYSFEETFGNDIAQLEKIILLGLDNCGYTIVKSRKNRVTKKKDEQAESIAATNNKYSKNILDYLLAKTLDEKEKVLTSLAIQLESTSPKDKYSKQNREFVQLLRHKDEKIKDPKYSWFFNDENYENNLDKLFKVYLSVIAHDDCFDYLQEFNSNKGDH